MFEKHSTHPATKLCVYFSRHFRALRKIKKGEELLHSYLGREFLGSNYCKLTLMVRHGSRCKTHLTNLFGHSGMAEIAPFACAVLQDFFAITL